MSRGDSSESLAIRSTVRDLVAAFQDAEATIRSSFAAIVEAEKRLNAVFTLGGNCAIRIEAGRHGYHDNFDDPAHAVERLKNRAWDVIVERLELRRMLSIKRYDELQRQISKGGDLPDITEANVIAFAEQYMTTLPELLTEAVQEVFEWLRPHYSRHKTNSELEVGRKVVLTWMVEPTWAGEGWRVVYGHEQRLTTLENVFNALDGRGQRSKTHYSAIQNAITASKSGTGETPLFKFKCFKNKNLHLEFLRADLLARFNQIAGGARLRPAREVA